MKVGDRARVTEDAGAKCRFFDGRVGEVVEADDVLVKLRFADQGGHYYMTFEVGRVQKVVVEG